MFVIRQRYRLENHYRNITGAEVMYTANKKDWELYRKKVADWQENYIGRLNQEYVRILNGIGNESDKFWELEKRIREDKKRPGVILELSKSDMFFDIVRFLKDGVISLDDLSGFSESLQAEVRQYLGIDDTMQPADTEESLERQIPNGDIARIVNKPDEAVALFHELYQFGVKIPYQIVKRGENAGQIKVRKSRDLDGQFRMNAEEYLRRRGRASYLDHIWDFRTEDNRTLVTMSPYLERSELSEDIKEDGKPRKLGSYM